MTQILARAAAAALRLYFQHLPIAVGKRAVWNRLARPLLRTGLVLEARTNFGARIEARFPDTIQSYAYFFGVWEPAITAYLAAALQPGDTVIDIGANVGYDSLLAWQRVGPAGRVYAVEASPTVFSQLRANLTRNGAAGAVTMINAAVCDSTTDVAVFLHDGSNLGGTTIVPAVAAHRHAVMEATVPGRPLAALVPEDAILSARLIKIDVEGAEWPVLRGFADLLPRLSARTELLVEVSAEGLEAHASSIPALLEMMRQAGFDAFVLRNPYDVDAYLRPLPSEPEPLWVQEFDQLDILFRRVSVV